MTPPTTGARRACGAFALLARRGLPRRAARVLTAAAVFCLVLLLGVPASAETAPTGTIVGQVLDGSTGKYLEGADVVVTGTELRALTQRDGSFVLTSVPAGPQVLSISYVGLETKDIPLAVEAGQSIPVAVRLTSDIIQLATYNVTTSREGMAQAVTLQRLSVQTKLVAAADQFGPVLEGNVGEYLKFMPGVTIDYNVNDARGVSLRGLSTAFTIVAVDGTPMAGGSSTDDTRRFEFEQIAMNNVETTELYKTVTADIPATATGGFVNFVTKSAFDTEEVQRITYDVYLAAPSSHLALGGRGGLWGHGKHATYRPNVELNLSRKLSPKIGLNVNYRLSEKYDDSPRTEFTWNTSTAYPTVMTNPRLQQYNIRSEQKLTHREAFATKLDFIVSDRTKLMVSGQWNFYDLDFTQRGPQFVLGANATKTGDDTYTSATSGAQVSNNVLYREKFGETWHFNGNLTHEFENRSTLSITPYYSKADGNYRDASKGFISTNSVLATSANTFTSFTLANPSTLGVLPTISMVRGTTALGRDYYTNLANYTLSNSASGTGFQSRPWTAEDTKDGVRADYTIDVERLTFPLKLQVGAQLDDTNRHIDRPDLRGVIPATTGNALLALQDPLYNRDVALGFGNYNAVDPFKAWETFKTVPMALNGLDIREIDERNTAAYVRGDVPLRRELTLIAGVRWEKRTIDAQGRTGSPTRARTSTANIDFDSWYPSAMLKYTPRRNLVIRGGFSRTVGIPDYSELLPTFTVPSTATSTDGTITVPAAGLKPYITMNYDLGADYYLKNSGVVSLNLFHKDVRNFISARPMTAAERTAYLADYGYTEADFGVTPGTIRANGAKSRLQGLEVSYSQNLTMLPKPFNGLSVQANFTYIDIATSDPDRFRALDTLYSQLRSVSPRTANLVVGYRYGRFNTTVTTNWVDESLYGGFVNTNYFLGTAATSAAMGLNPPDLSRDTRFTLNKDEKTTVDWKLEYSINKHVSAYFVVRNLFNSARREFLRGYLPEYKNVVLPLRYFEFGEPHLSVGVRGTF